MEEASIERVFKRMHRLAKAYHAKVRAMKEKYDELGWYHVPLGEVLPKENQEVLVIVDKRISQDGDIARSLEKSKYFGNPKELIRIRHGFVNQIHYEPDIQEYSIEIRENRCRTTLSVRLIIGTCEHVMFWRPMIDLPPMPKFTKEEFSYSEHME